MEGATCTLRAILPNGQDAPGVKNPKVAVAGGYVGWWYPMYPVDDDGNGMGTHIVRCNYNGLSGTAIGTFDLS